jgi:hypothetical protein
MGFFGKLLGGLAGSLGSALLPIPGADGKQIGEHLGSMLPFQEGGLVPQRVFHNNAVVARRPRRRYQKSAGSKRKTSKRKK